MRAVRPADSRAGLARSIRLFRLFLREQSAPEVFYSELARDSVAQLQRWTALRDAVVIDVGGGPGYFARAFAGQGARYVGIELDVPTDLPADAHALVASAMTLPLRSESVDVAYSSNVIEHLREPWRMAEEMVRVTRPGGLIYLSFTPWYSPWGGHETAPWHYLGGDRARRRYLRTRGREPKNAYGQTLFAHRVSDALRWAADCADAEVVTALPRYHPRWAWWLTRVPAVREVALWNLALVMRKR